MRFKIQRKVKKVYFLLMRFLLWIRFFKLRLEKVDTCLDEAKLILSEYLPSDLKAQHVNGFSFLERDDKVMLSLIVPVYNEEKNIKKCFDSLLNQETDFIYELVVLDNASTDSSPDILAKYTEDSRVRLITIKVNRGGSVARNIGINKAKGKYIGFIDSDDKVAPNYVQRLLEEAIAADADVVKSGFWWDYDGKIVPHHGKVKRVYDKGLGDDIFKYDGYIWDAIYKRELWDDIRFPEEYWYEDIIMKMLVFRKCKSFIYIPEPLYYYYVNPASTSKMQNENVSLKALEQYHLVEYYSKYSEKIGLKNDIVLYKDMLHELGDMLYRRTARLDIKYREAIFVMAAELIDEYKSKNDLGVYVLSKDDELLEKAFQNKSFAHWEMASRYKHCCIELVNM